MSEVTELVRRAQRLQDHVELLRLEVGELRKDLQRLQAERAAVAPEATGPDCLTVALALAEDLGPEFSSEDQISR